MYFQYMSSLPLVHNVIVTSISWALADISDNLVVILPPAPVVGASTEFFLLV